MTYQATSSATVSGVQSVSVLVHLSQRNGTVVSKLIAGRKLWPVEYIMVKRKKLIQVSFKLAASAAALALASSQVLADDSAESTLDVEATLSPAMTIECETALNFGELIVPVGDRDSATDIKLDPENGLTGDGKGEVTFGGGSEPGECKVTGGPADEEFDISLSYDGTDLGTDEDGESFELGESGDNAPVEPASLEVKLHLSSGKFSINEDQEGSFQIGGNLKIPGSLEEANFGDYQATITVKVGDDL